MNHDRTELDVEIEVPARCSWSSCDDASVDALSQFFAQRVIGHVDLDMHLLDAGDGRNLVECSGGLAAPGPDFEASARGRRRTVQVDHTIDLISRGDTPCYGC